MTLGDIVENGEVNADKSQNTVNFKSVDKYIIQLIRVSELYKFELKIKPKKHLKKAGNRMPKAENAVNVQNKNGELNNAEIEEEIRNDSEGIRRYINFEDKDSEDVKIVYNNGAVKKDPKEYRVKKPEKTGYQELWEKEGFYQEKTYMAKVKVQLWPEHLPYDHLKRKRAFLFC